MATIRQLDLIYETNNFMLMRAPHPLVSREEGGHMRIFPKDGEGIGSRTNLSPAFAIEFMRLSMLSGESLQKAMNQIGIQVVRINYQELGNWAYKEQHPRPVLHLHIFGRVKNAAIQKFPEAIQLPSYDSGFYRDFEPLAENDMELIGDYMNKLSKTDKYNLKNWGIN